MRDFNGKTAFVTGGASGIGLGIAKALLADGANVAIADIRRDHLDEAVKELDGGDKVLALQLDITDRGAYKAAADETEAKFGKIHVLINNAGVAVVGPTELATHDDWDWVMGVNLGGTVNGIVEILPRILSHGEGGHVLCTASMSALVPVGGTAIYSSSKAAVTSIMECMRPELEQQGVICHAFCPGAVQSNIADAGATRPDELADSGYAEADKSRREGGNFFHLYQTKEEVGERVVQGMKDEELYILTHAEFLDGVRERGDATTLAVQDHLPENEDYKKTFAMLFSNPAIRDEVERQRQLKTGRE